jgi:hypothetical protein
MIAMAARHRSQAHSTGPLVSHRACVALLAKVRIVAPNLRASAAGFVQARADVHVRVTTQLAGHRVTSESSPRRLEPLTLRDHLPAMDRRSARCRTR